jgi:hypothetical protein
MCSGCSDYYQGEGDDPETGEPFSARRERQEEGRPASEPEAKWPGGDATERAALREMGSSPDGGRAGRGAEEWEDYEVLVSAYCIIERRRIPANCCAISAQEASEKLGVWQETQRERERSRASSANSYQTRGQFASELPDRNGTACMFFMLWGLAGAMAMGLVIWLAVG